MAPPERLNDLKLLGDALLRRRRLLLGEAVGEDGERGGVTAVRAVPAARELGVRTVSVFERADAHALCAAALARLVLPPTSACAREVAGDA